MQVLTYTAVAGTAKCNLRCPFCVAVMTPHYPVAPEINVRNFVSGADLAIRGGAVTFLITGKGEPTLYPEQITEMLSLAGPKFPICEMQTNGLRIANGELDQYLPQWYTLGLKTIAVSIVHWDAEKNIVMNPRQQDQMPDLANLVEKIHSFGINVRLSVIMVKGYIDSLDEVRRMISWASEHGVEQLTLTPISQPDEPEYQKVANWVSAHALPTSLRDELRDFMLHLVSALDKSRTVVIIYHLSGRVSIQPEDAHGQ